MPGIIKHLGVVFMKKSIIFILCLLTLSVCGCQSKTSAKETPASSFEYEIVDYDGYVSILQFKGLEKDVVIPKEIESLPVKVISDSAFMGTEVESVRLSDTVERIDGSCFYKCQNLKSVYMGKALKTIGHDAFYKCEALEDIKLNKGIESIGYKAFLECTALKNITIPSTVKEIGTEAFYGAGLTSIQFEDGIEKIGSYAAFCSKGTIESITIPASVTEIGEYVFNKNLKSVHFLGDAPQKIGTNPFDESTIIYYKKGTSNWDNEALSQYQKTAE